MAGVGADPVLDEGPARGPRRRVLVVAGFVVTLFGVCLMAGHTASADSDSASPTTPASAGMSQRGLLVAVLGGVGAVGHMPHGSVAAPAVGLLTPATRALRPLTGPLPRPVVRPAPPVSTPAANSAGANLLPGRPGAISGTAATSPRPAASPRPSAPSTAVDPTTNLTHPAASDHAHPAGVSTDPGPSGDSQSLPVGSSASPELPGNPPTATGSSCGPVAVLRFAGDRFGRATARSAGVVPSADGRPGAFLFDSRGPRLPG